MPSKKKLCDSVLQKWSFANSVELFSGQQNASESFRLQVKSFGKFRLTNSTAQLGRFSKRFQSLQNVKHQLTFTPLALWFLLAPFSVAKPGSEIFAFLLPDDLFESICLANILSFVLPDFGQANCFRTLATANLAMPAHRRVWHNENVHVKWILRANAKTDSRWKFSTTRRPVWPTERGARLWSYRHMNFLFFQN